MFLSDDRRDAFLPLSATGMPAEAIRRLEALGVTTLEELRDTWTYGNRQLLTDYLGESPVRFTMVRPSATLSRSEAASGPGESVNLLASGPVRPLVRHARGLALSSTQLKRRAEAPPPVALAGRRGGRSIEPGRVSLIDRFPAIRDQGQRGTCVAFASMAYLEFHLAGGSAKASRQSEQFLYWACKELDGTTNEGTTLAAARKALKTYGVCRNATWKYEPMPIASNEGQGPPPARAVAEAKGMKWSKAKEQKPDDVDALRAHLDQGRPVVLGVLTFPTWNFPVVADTGEINLPVPLTQPDGGHAICLVGYELRPNAPGGGVFLFRNSWGKTWAGKGRYKAGYGTLFFEYVRQYAVEAYF
jgi:Papain family cysteine protease